MAAGPAVAGVTPGPRTGALQNHAMRRTTALITLSALLCPLLLPAHAVAQPVPTLATLGWLAGCWQSTLDEPGSGEQWMAPAGGSMLGMARTLKGGRTVQFEFMQLRESATGLSLIAQPGGRQPAVFVAKEATAEAAVFERQSAEFPQRVAYRLQPDGSLAARIEGDAGGQPRGVDFPMRRVACPGGR